MSEALLTPEVMGDVDRESAIAGVNGIELMEAAGAAIADLVLQRWPDRPVLILCGPGNNGGDGFVAARHLAASGVQVRVSVLGDADGYTGDAGHHKSLWHGAIESFDPALVDGAGPDLIVVDALFGAGLSRPIAGPARTMIEAVTTSRATVCAVDIPSGVDGATGEVRGVAAPATTTITFVRKKPGHVLFPGRRLCGEVVVANIGTPAAALAGVPVTTWENSPALWQANYPWPSASSNKFTRGSVLVLGGGEITGASRLTARAALRIGAGLVTLAAPTRAWSIYATALTSVMVKQIGDGRASSADDFATLLDDQRINSVAVGPGAGVGDGTARAVLRALARVDGGRTVVLDADALTSFADRPDVLFEAIQGPCILTPHEGEFARLFSTSGDKLARARSAAALSGAIIVLKGNDTVIAAPDGRAVINTNAPADLATAGAGDVLTGCIAGLAAQGCTPFDAACAAAWIHGASAAAFGPGLIADDLPDLIPTALRHLDDLRE